MFQAAVGAGTAIGFAAFVLPVSLLLVAITAIGLLALGLFSWALLHPKTAKVWRMAKNKLFGIATDLFHLPGTVFLTPFAFEPNATRKQEGKQTPLVVFVHGFLHNKTCWNSLAKELQNKTKGTLHPITKGDMYAINFGAPVTVKEIDHYSRFLATKLEQIRKERKLTKLDVILDCHSMGGLVAGHFAADYASLAGVNVLRLISNGTPWHGTPVAHLGAWADCGKQMRPNHAFQKKLSPKIKAIGKKVYTIASKGDTIVPYHSARASEIDIPKDHRITLDHPFGHLAMLHSKQARRENLRLIMGSWNEQTASIR